MSKRSKKRAFFVSLLLFLLYVSVALQLPDKVSMKRVSIIHKPAPQAMSLHGSGTGEAGPADGHEAGISPIPAAHADTETQASVPVQRVTSENPRTPPTFPEKASHTVPPPAVSRDGSSIEPSLLISVPIVCHAIKEGWIEKESLIFLRKDEYNSTRWKKPLDILRDRDEEGVKSILNTIGKNYVLGFLKEEGIVIGRDVTPESVMLGRGYMVEKDKLLGLYNRHVSEAYNDLFPFRLPQMGIARGKQGFEFVSPRDGMHATAQMDDREWLMPNLANLPVRVAIERLAPRTSKIKVYGSGIVVSQSPRAFERLHGDSECSIQGRPYSE